MPKQVNIRQSEIKVHRNYYMPGNTQHQLVKKNAIFINSKNTIRHELSKTIGGIMVNKWNDIKWSDKLKGLVRELEKEVNFVMKDFDKDSGDFITEAVPVRDPKRRIDLVMLSTESHIEWENKKDIKKGDVTIVI